MGPTAAVYVAELAIAKALYLARDEAAMHRTTQALQAIFSRCLKPMHR